MDKSQNLRSLSALCLYICRTQQPSHRLWAGALKEHVACRIAPEPLFEAQEVKERVQHGARVALVFETWAPTQSWLLACSPAAHLERDQFLRWTPQVYWTSPSYRARMRCHSLQLFPKRWPMRQAPQLEAKAQRLKRQPNIAQLIELSLHISCTCAPYAHTKDSKHTRRKLCPLGCSNFGTPLAVKGPSHAFLTNREHYRTSWAVKVASAVARIAREQGHSNKVLQVEVALSAEELLQGDAERRAELGCRGRLRCRLERGATALELRLAHPAASLALPFVC